MMTENTSPIIGISVTEEEFIDILDSYFCRDGDCCGDCYRDVVEDRSECIWDAITMNLPGYAELNQKYKESKEYINKIERLGLSMALEAGWDQSDFESTLNKIRDGTYLDSETIDSLNYRIGRWQQDYNNLEKEHNEKILELNNQINMLKTKCRDYCRKSIWLDHADRSMESAISATNEKLSREMPDIFKENEAQTDDKF